MMKAQDHENLATAPRLVGSCNQPPRVTRQGDMDVLVIECSFDMCKTGFAEDNTPSCVPMHGLLPQHQDSGCGAEGQLRGGQDPRKAQCPDPGVPHGAGHHHPS